MAIFEAVDDKTGEVFEIEGDRPPTQQEVLDLIASIQQPAITLTQQAPPVTQEQPGALESGVGALETGATIASGIVAEPVAGLAGLITAPIVGSERASEIIDSTRQFFSFQPRTEAGKESLESVGQFLAPVSEFISDAEQSFGDAVFEKTDSPFLASIATTVPTIAGELIGVGLFKGLAKTGRGAAKIIKEREIKGTLKKAAPEPEQLFDVSRGIYDELNNLGVKIKPDRFTGLTSRIQSQLIKNGIDKDVTPKSSKAFNRLKERVGDEITLTELDTLRSVAKGAANDVNSPQEALLGNIIIDNIDEFLSFSGEQIFNKPTGLDVPVSKRFQAARELWGRGRKSELITDALEKAENQATGFENGIRNQFRSIINNKKQKRFFTESEILDMKKVVRGDKTSNFFKLLGKFGFSEGQAKNVIGGSLGLGAGFAIGGGAGAAAAVTLGSSGRFVSRIITEGRANLFNDLLRAGRNGRRITRAYIENTPKGKRSSSDLAALLIGEGVDLSRLPKSKFVNEAAEIAAENKRAITRGVTGAEVIKDPRLNLELSLAEDENNQ